MNYIEFYKENTDFRNYVDRYCAKHAKTPAKAVEDAMCRYYAEYLVKKSEGKVVTTTQIGCGC